MAISTHEMLKHAYDHGYAIPAFNIHNLETIQVAVDVASELQSPIILAATPSTISYAGPGYLVSIVDRAIKENLLPIALHLDHATDIDMIKSCIDYGFKSVMVDGSHLPFEENVEMTNTIVSYAKHKFVSVEAELGRLSGIEDDILVDRQESELTDPDVCGKFIEATGVDSLAIAIGTAHGMYKSQPKLDFERLRDIRKTIEIPLVLHGASGIKNIMINKAIELGINKVNIATELKEAFGRAVRRYLINNPNQNDPRHYLTPGKEAMAEVVRSKIILCNSAGRVR